jgi:dienelactone hydrolase
MRLTIPLFCAATLAAQIPARWFAEPVMPAEMRRSEMYAFVNANIPPLPRFASLDQWKAYKATLKPRILRLLGIDDVLVKDKLKLIRRGTLDRDGYTIEKIDYESYPGMYVPALVWVPKGLTGDAPAVVSISGHLYCDSKAGDYVQARDYNLVRRGFIVLSYDYFGCFERARTDPCAAGAWGGEDHTNSLFSYTRRTPTGIEVLDGIRAIDYLYSRPDVDRARLGFTGEPGGGNSTYWVSALDDRVTLSMPVSAAGAFEQWIKVDTAPLAALVAPRPLVILSAGLPGTRRERRDYFSPLPRFVLPEAQVSPDELAANYGWTKRFYTAPGAGVRFETGARDVAQWFTQNY